MTCKAPADCELGIEWNEDLFKDIYQRKPELSYTNFVVDERGIWFCPSCNSRKNAKEWALMVRGYANLPTDYPRPIHASYGPDFSERLYFQNPPCVVQCMNYWDMGLSGIRCTFNREEAEGFRDKVGEEKQDRLQPDSLGCCSQCAVRVQDLPNDPEREAYVFSQTALEFYTWGKSHYSLLMHDPWFDEQRWARSFVYGGNEKSLECQTLRYGEGNDSEDSKNKRCTGRYGGPVFFLNYHNKVEPEVEREEVETGQLIPLDTIARADKNPTTYVVYWEPEARERQ